MRVRHVAALAVGLALPGLMTACGGDDSEAAPEIHELALGTAATVEFYPSDGGTEPIGEGAVTITAVRKGSADDLLAAGYTLDPEEQESTPYYVDVAFENHGTTKVEPREPGGVDDTDDSILPLILIDLGGTGFEKCPGVPDQIGPGAKAAGCSIVLVPSGRSLERIFYLPSASVDDIYWAVS